MQNRWMYGHPYPNIYAFMIVNIMVYTIQAYNHLWHCFSLFWFWLVSVTGWESRVYINQLSVKLYLVQGLLKLVQLLIDLNLLVYTDNIFFIDWFIFFFLTGHDTWLSRVQQTWQGSHCPTCWRGGICYAGLRLKGYRRWINSVLSFLFSNRYSSPLFCTLPYPRLVNLRFTNQLTSKCPSRHHECSTDLHSFPPCPLLRPAPRPPRIPNLRQRQFQPSIRRTQRRVQCK